MKHVFPKPWRLEQSDPGCNFWVLDANDRKLFHISSDENPDGEGKPGDPDGPTVLEFGTDTETNNLLDMIANSFHEVQDE